MRPNNASASKMVAKTRKLAKSWEILRIERSATAFPASNVSDLPRPSGPECGDDFIFISESLNQVCRALAHARLARTRTTHSPTPYLTSGERSHKFNLPTTNSHDRHARHNGLHPEPQISHSPRTPPPATMRNVHTFHETHSSAQQQERSKNIRRSQLLRCSRTPGPAADAQRRHRCRHHRLARAISTGFWATSRPPVVPGWRRRLPRESPTLSGSSLSRAVSLAAPNDAPCLMLLDASPLPLDLVVGSCLLQHLIPQIMPHDAIHTHTHTHTHTHAGSILALTYTTDTQHRTRARLFRLRLTYARNTSAETSLHRPAHRTYPNEGGPIGCTARKGGTPYTTFTLPA